MPLGARRLIGVARHAQRAFELVWQTDRRLSLALVALTVGTGLLPAGVAYVGKLIVDGVVRAVATPSPALRHGVFVLVAAELGLALALVALQRALAVCDALLRVRLGQRVIELVLTKALTLSLADFETPALYDRLLQVREQATERPLSLARHALLALQLSVTFAGFLALLVKFSPWLVALLLLAALPAVLLEARFNADAFRLFRAHSPDARRQSYLETVLTREDHAKEVKQLGLASLLLDRHRQIFQKWFAADRALTLRRALWGFALALVAASALAASYAWVAWQAMAGLLSVGALAMLFVVLRQAQSSATELLLVLAQMHEDHLYLDALYEFLAYPSSAPTGTAEEGTSPGDGLRFEDVEFRYPDAEAPALQGFDFHLAPGRKVAVVGRNGSGKSTLVKLALGLYTPTGGRVLLDGRDLREWAPAALARRFSVQFQDFVHYQLPVSDNVGFGALELAAGEREWARAAERAFAHGLIARLPQGYETQLGRWFESGHELSLGEWQKVALARAFLREGADMLILDEPSASLDTESESAILSGLSKWAHVRSTLMISHRSSTLRFADEILVLERGVCVARGSHRELLENSGIYASLFGNDEVRDH